MNEAWYRVAGMAFSVFSAFSAGLVAFLSIRQNRLDVKTRRQAERDTPGAFRAYAFRVVSAGNSRRLAEGDRFPIPDEGILGSARSCDVVIPSRDVPARCAFFRSNRDGLHMTPLGRGGFDVDGESAEPGDEAILQEGAELRLKKLILRLEPAGKGEGAPLTFRLRGGKASPDGKQADMRKAGSGNTESENHHQRGKKREKRRGKTGEDTGTASSSKKGAEGAPSRAARGKGNG